MQSNDPAIQELFPVRPPSRPRVLVVEDEAVVAFDLQQRLRQMGYTVTGVAHSGQEAIHKAFDTRPELVLMDIGLDCGMSGIEAALAIRKQQDLPIIYVTANSDAHTVRRAATSGPFGFILKPFEDRELDTAIQIRMVKHEMDRRLLEGERRFNATLTSIADGVIAVGGSGCIEFFNPVAETITGWQRQEVLGHKLTNVMLLRDDGTHHKGTDFFSSLHLPAGHGRVYKTALLVRRDGSDIPIEYHAAHIYDDHHRVTGTVISFSDIRARKLAEERIRRAQAELCRAHESLTHKHEELQKFYHTVSHELKTPLTSVREFTSLTLDELAGPITKTQREYLTIALESCDRMRTSINDMLDVTRLETGKMSLELALASIAELVRGVVTTFKPAAERNQIELRYLAAPGVPEIMMDGMRITQVVTNLLNNALKFTGEGGRVTVSVDVSATRPDHVEIVVRDTGCGISKAHLGRIFDRLYQVRDENSVSCQGLGLGLHICQELVHLHGGTIHAESEIGVGTAFCVSLPRAPARPFATLKLTTEEMRPVEKPVGSNYETNPCN